MQAATVMPDHRAGTGTPDHIALLATITAKLELAGHVVQKLETGFLVNRWGLTLHCPDLPALEKFARQVGVKG